MHLVSTRDRAVTASFEEAIFSGLAPDGGLFELAEPPDLSEIIANFGPTASFVDIASELSAALLSNELSREVVDDLCRTAFPFEPVLRHLEPRIDLLELFHGPSCAFKDFGASFLATTMERFLKRSGNRAIILTATSGDTGSAVAQAFHRRTGIDVVILYPSGRVSPLQEQQLTTVGDNVHALEVDGAFDDCQRMVKEAFLDGDLRSKLPLTSANSINIGRLLPQAFYYVWAAARYRPANGADARTTRNAGRYDTSVPVRFCVPSGNFGNLTAGVMAWQWGMRCRGFIAATNVNDVVPEYLDSAVFTPRPSVRTYSNAMDVGNPSNFERLQAIFNGDHDRMAAVLSGSVVTNRETAEEIKRTYEATGTFLCPHTAVGVLSARRSLETIERDETLVTLGTARHAKFGEVIEEATGSRPELPGRLADAMSRQKVATAVDGTLDSLRAFLLDCFG